MLKKSAKTSKNIKENKKKLEFIMSCQKKKLMVNIDLILEN
jgi:hypothetical protein